MPKPYSVDLRARVVEGIKHGATLWRRLPSDTA